MKNSADLGGCYPPRPSASVDNTLLYLQNSSYPTQPHSIIAHYCIRIILILYKNNFIQSCTNENVRWIIMTNGPESLIIVIFIKLYTVKSMQPDSYIP